MNRFYAKWLILVFLVVVGVFQIARGIAGIRSRTESTLVGWLRITLGIILAVLIPVLLMYYLRSNAGE